MRLAEFLLTSLGVLADHRRGSSSWSRKLGALGALLLCSLSARSALAAGAIRWSSLGFRPSSAKVATFLGGGRFTLRRSSDGQPVFSGLLASATRDAASGQAVSIGDFSAVRTSGDYYLELESCERSAAFPIASTVYVEAYRTMMLGFYGQRCGTEVALTHDGAEFRHAPCHTGEVDLSYFDGAGQPRAINGGWHDAGDYGRYTVNGGFTAAILLRAWEDFSAQLAPIALVIPETGGALPDFLAETRWQLDWLLAMEYADGSGRFSNALKSPDYAPFVAPENDPSPIALASASSMGTAVAGAVLAQAARVYRAYDSAFADRCQQAAERAYAWLTANPNLLLPSQDWAAAYDYGDTPGDATSQALEGAARFWLAAELWATTGNDSALSYFEAHAGEVAYAFNPAPDWVDPSDLGIITYLRSGSAQRSSAVVEGLSASVLGAAASLESAHSATGNGWGRAQGYWWGANGTTARSCMIFELARRLDGESTWQDLCTEQIGYLLGRNPYGRSQVTGIGLDPPLFPHHRPSSGDGVQPPWPGLLVGGPQQNGADWLDWTDSEGDYMTNETAINWNASLVYAFAGLLSDDSSSTRPESASDTMPNISTSCAPYVDVEVDAGPDAGRAADGPETRGDDVDAVARARSDTNCGCRLPASRSLDVAWCLSATVLLLVARRRRR